MSETELDNAQLERMEVAADWLQRLQSSPRDEALAIEWFDWCQASPENLAAFERIQAVWQAFDVVQAPRAPVRARRRAFALPLALAATVAVACVSGWWILRPQSVDTLTTDVAEHGSQVLADGSQVDLGGRTRIATRYSPDERTVVVEEGEAFFTVAKDPGRPFVVNAGNVRITALGTAFSVRRTVERTVVTVSEGLVGVAPVGKAGKRASAAAAEHELLARAGDQVTYSATENRLTLAQAGPGAATTWKQGVLKFVDEPLGEVIDDINRYSARPIELTDPALRRRVYTGTVYRERIGDWAEALERVFPLRSIESADEIKLVPLPPEH